MNDVKAELQHHNYVTDLAQSVKTLAHSALKVIFLTEAYIVKKER